MTREELTVKVKEYLKRGGKIKNLTKKKFKFNPELSERFYKNVGFSTVYNTSDYSTKTEDAIKDIKRYQLTHI